MISLINRRIGTVTLDAVVSESHQSDLRITENPIESGAQIADHAVLEPRSVTITGVMVDHERQAAKSATSKLPGIRGANLNFLNKIQPMSLLSGKTAQTAARVQRELSSFTSSLLPTSGLAGTATRALAPWLPSFASLGATDQSTGGAAGRVRQAFDDLSAAQRSGETIEIETGLRLYQNMMVTSVSVSQTKDGSAEFNIAAREVMIVDTETIAGVHNPVSGAKKSGRAAAQSAAKSQKGKVQAPTKESSLSVLGGGRIKGALDKLSGKK